MSDTPLPTGQARIIRLRTGDAIELGNSRIVVGRDETCDFVAWNPVVVETCPECSYVGAEAKSSKARGEFRKCLKCQNEWDVVPIAEPVTA